MAALVFLGAFGLYGFTTSVRYYGYEAETVAAAEGFVKTGRFQLLEDSPLLTYGHGGKDGRLYARAPFAQPLLQAPFYLAGWALDGLRSAPPEYRYRELVLRFYNPFVAALAAAGVFGIVLLVRGSMRWAIATAAAFTVASIAWPYSKIGMETTLMLFVVLSVLGVVVAARAPRPLTWAAAGAAMGMAAASKPYGLVIVLPLLAMLWEPWRARERRARLRVALALAGALGLFLALIAHHNWVRHGSITDFAVAAYTPTGWAPVNALGFLFSPGKGLAWYSPLILIGLLGLPRLWRAHRGFALALVATVAVGIAVPSIPSYWTDEMWGPRYVVPVAGLLLIPIAWWATTRARAVLVAALAVVGVLVQAVGVAVPYEYYVRASTPYHTLVGAELPLAGLPYTAPEPPALGHDANRWVPELSPLAFQANVLVSTTKESLGADPTVIHYRPYAGKPVAFDLGDAEVRFGMAVPDFWWTAAQYQDRSKLLAGALAAISVLSAALLAAAARRPRRGNADRRAR